MKILSDLLHGINPKQIIGLTDISILSIEHNSRTCEKKSLFIAIKGTTTDGHTFIQNAIDNGATAIICENLPDDLIKDITYILVENARSTAADISHIFYDNPSSRVKIYGVTGTNGKTTVTFILKQLLEAYGEKCGIIGTTGNYFGDKKLETKYTTPEAPELCKILSEMAEAGITTVIMEVSSHSLIMERVRAIRFSAALFTNLTHDHLDFHGTMEEYAQAKKILFDMLPPDAIAIVNGDSVYSHYMLTDCKAKRKYTVGMEHRFDAIIHSVECSLQGTHFSLDIDGSFPETLHTRYMFSSSLLGFFNVENMALCISLCLALGMDKVALLEAVRQSQGAPGRMETIPLPNNNVAIIDYAHTPDALEKVLRTCRTILHNFSSYRGKLITVFGCGGNRDAKKRPLMGSIASELSDSVIITSDNPRNEHPQVIAEEILRGFTRMIPVHIILDRKEAIETALSSAHSGDIVLIAGKGHETTQTIGGSVLHFSDREIVEKNQ